MRMVMFGHEFLGMKGNEFSMGISRGTLLKLSSFRGPPLISYVPLRDETYRYSKQR